MFPRIFHFGSITLHSYGLLVALSFGLGLWVAMRLAGQRGLDPSRVFDLGVYIALAGVAGSKLFMLVEDWRYFLSHPGDLLTLSFWRAGGVFYGGFLAALAVAVWYLRRNRMPFLETADAFAPALVIGHALGRVGCFAAGCCWGHPTNLPWAVTFTDPYAKELVGVPLGVPLHPAQLYESAALLGIFGLLLLVWKRRGFPGQVLSAYLVLYGAARFALEFTRDRSGSHLPMGLLSLSQGIALLLVPAGLALWLRPRQAASSSLPHKNA